ncbi:MAG: hypothetical protein ACLFTI_04465 [Anaerolineales bacterium]
MRKSPRQVAFINRLRAVLPSFLLFAALTLTLDAQSLWWDEGISLHLAAAPWAEIVADRAANIHPPLYFFALKGWITLVGATPFAARYLSTLLATLLPAAGGAWMRHRMNRRSGRTTALLLALAPPFFIYGQEVRAYAALPLLALALLAEIWPSPSLHDEASAPRPARLALIQALFILTHYAGVIAVGWANVILLARALRARSPRRWRDWGRSLAWTGLFLAPWSLVVIQAGAVGLRANAALHVSNALAEPIPWRYGLQLVAIFHAVGLPQALSDPLLTRSAALTGILLLAGVIYVGMARLRRRLKAYRDSLEAKLTPQNSAFIIRNSSFAIHHSSFILLLLAAWLLPLTAAPVIWQLSPQAHPRYLFPFVLGGWLAAAALIGSRAMPHWFRALLLSAIMMMSLLGVRAYLTEPRYARSDMRAAAALLRDVAAPGDVALLPNTDWSLPQYDTGAARPVMLPAPTDDAAVAATVARATTPGRTVYALDYRRGALDPRGQVRALLAWGGTLTARYDVPGLFLEVYEMTATPRAPAPTPVARACIAGAAPCLTGAALPERPESGAALPVVLQWEGGPAPKRYAVALRLYAPGDILVASQNDLLVDARVRPTEQWAREPVTTYHRVELPTGLTPRPYRLEVGVYDPQDGRATLSWIRADAPPVPAVTVGAVTPGEDARVGSDWVPVGPTAEVDEVVRLEGSAVEPREVYPGQQIFVTLWQRLEADGVPPAQRLVLRQGDRTLASMPALESMPAMAAGRPLLEHLALTAPPEAADGPATVTLLSSAGEEIPLAEITIHAGEHTFVVPESQIDHPMEARVKVGRNGIPTSEIATLLGYSLDPISSLQADRQIRAIRAGEPLTLTLVWRAEANAARDLAVFTHLIGAEGQIIAQHDGPPANGAHPTRGWLPGEVIVDPHVLTWRREERREYRGAATLRVGLYDPAIGERLLWASGEDALTLTSQIRVE